MANTCAERMGYPGCTWRFVNHSLQISGALSRQVPDPLGPSQLAASA